MAPQREWYARRRPRLYYNMHTSNTKGRRPHDMVFAALKQPPRTSTPSQVSAKVIDELSAALSNCLTITDEIVIRSPTAPPTRTICHFFRLPREIREMIYDYASRDNVYYSRDHPKQSMREIRYPISTKDEFPIYVPDTLAANQTVNKLIFDESLPIHIRNTTFDFDSIWACFELIEYMPIRQNITTVRVHQHQTPFWENENIARLVNWCPRLTDVSYFIHKEIAMSLLNREMKWRMGMRQWPAAMQPPVCYFDGMRGLERFRLCFVECEGDAALSLCLQLEKDIQEVVMQPKGMYNVA